MALIYKYTLPSDKWLLSENNNIIQLTDSVNTRAILYAEFTIGTETPARVYADPNGVVWYNVKENVSIRLNDYSDDLNFSNVTPSNINTFFLNWSKTYLNYVIEVKVVFTNAEEETDTLDSNFLLGLENQIEVFKGETVKDNDIVILSPLKDDSTTINYLNYWEGYPFDIGFTKKISDGLNITTITNLSTQQTSPAFSVTNDVSRLVLTNGSTSITLEDYLPLAYGLNVLQFDTNTFIELNKLKSSCGIYIKWMNNKGGFNYWLFENSSNDSKSRSNGAINNDFYNIEESISPTKSLGRTVEETITVYYEQLSNHDIKILKGLIASPKIYIFTGERYSPSLVQNWLEVTIPNKSINTGDFKNKIPNGTIVLELPNNNTISL